MNKRGIIIILYSVALLAVLSVILLATVQPKSFVVEVGQTHADIVRITEVVQNYNSYKLISWLFLLIYLFATKEDISYKL